LNAKSETTTTTTTINSDSISIEDGNNKVPQLFVKKSDNNDGGSSSQLALYLVSKWSNDNGSLKYDNFVHYGIPRAKLRRNNNNNNFSFNDNLSTELSSISATSDYYSDISSVDTINSFSQLETTTTTTTTPTSIDDFRPIKSYYYKGPHSNPPYIDTLKKLKKIEKEEKRKLAIKRMNQYNVTTTRVDCNRVEGGIVTNVDNVYYPTVTIQDNRRQLLGK
jgi:hypothetical protein